MAQSSLSLDKVSRCTIVFELRNRQCSFKEGLSGFAALLFYVPPLLIPPQLVHDKVPTRDVDASEQVLTPHLRGRRGSHI